MKKIAITFNLLSSLLLLLLATPAQAMKISEFSQICASTPAPCADIPLIRAYVGGALDLLASLDENTEYLTQIYCKPAQELFDAARIIQFMQSHQNENPARNAMVLVIQYMEEESGCSQ